MKRILLAAIFSLITANALAQASDYETTPKPYQPPLPQVGDVRINVTPENAFYFKPYLTIEYSAADISGGGDNTNFRASEALDGQIKNFQNIAIGGHFRVQKYLGFNLNYARNEMQNNTVNGFGLSREAQFNISHINASALIFAPVVADTLEIFAEIGASDMQSKLTYIDGFGNSLNNKSHETKALLGGGVQANFNKTSSLRLSFQKYSGKLALLDSHYTTVRIGYLHSF